MARAGLFVGLLAVPMLAGCMSDNGGFDGPGSFFGDEVTNLTGQTEAEFTAPFRQGVAAVEIHREDVRVLDPEDELASAIIDEALTGLYRVHQWYKEVGSQPPESRALLNSSEYVVVKFNDVQRFNFVFKESDGALDSIVILLAVEEGPMADFVDHVVTCLEFHCQRLVSNDNDGRRERLDAMTN